MFNGLGTDLSNLFLMSNAKTRSISPENFTGEKGKGAMATLDNGIAANAGRELGEGWKLNPFIVIEEHSTAILAEIEGPGCIQHIWMTPSKSWRNLILRFYWDDEKYPSVECPVGDFFACGWDEYAKVVSMPVCVNPGSAFNCYWQMPFRKRCKITMENIADEPGRLFYQVDYCLTEVPDDAAYFHAQYRRQNPIRFKVPYTIVDNIRGKGQYVGTYICWGSNSSGWWGEGEIKFYMDGDDEYPTICGTGTEDYFCGSYNFENKKEKRYEEFNTPYAGLPQVVLPDGLYRSQTRFGMYRWHIPDPIRFESELRVTIQALGWRSGHRYLPLQDDISSVAFWYQSTPHEIFPELPDKDALEII